MTIQIDDFYSSSNGDRCRLVRDIETGHRTVRHEPNLASGGQVTDTAIAEFLDRTGISPQNVALRALLEKHLPAEYRAGFTWRQLPVLLTRAAQGKEEAAEVATALQIVLQLEGRDIRHTIDTLPQRLRPPQLYQPSHIQKFKRQFGSRPIEAFLRVLKELQRRNPRQRVPATSLRRRRAPVPLRRKV